MRIIPLSGLKRRRRASSGVSPRRGRSKGVFTATGKSISAQRGHVWTVGDGTLKAVQQHLDALQAAEAGRSSFSPPHSSSTANKGREDP
jgi:hypothetical protein